MRASADSFETPSSEKLLVNPALFETYKKYNNILHTFYVLTGTLRILGVGFICTGP